MYPLLSMYSDSMKGKKRHEYGLVSTIDIRGHKHMTIEVKSNWTGSENTFNLVHKQIAERWGTEEAERYNPKENCLTFRQWLKNGYSVRKGEKAIRSFVIVEKKDKKTGEVIERRPKTINLFYELQVEPKAV